MRIAQVGDVALVAPALAKALEGDEVRQVRMPQRGASLAGPLKLMAGPLRLIDAARVARRLSRLDPDIVHIHWIPNGIVGVMLNRPWVLHIHGSDVRGVGHVQLVISKYLMRAAGRCFVSTPDLLKLVPGAVWLPTPIPRIDVKAPTRFDVLVNARAHPAKGSELTFAALRLIHSRDPSLRLAAMDGPAFETGPWERVSQVPKDEFHRLLAASEVVVGQFQAGALGIADLETLAIGRPLVTFIEDIYPDPPPISNAKTANEIAGAVLRPLRSSDGPDWVARTHGPDLVARRARAVYRDLLRD